MTVWNIRGSGVVVEMTLAGGVLREFIMAISFERVGELSGESAAREPVA